jgi:T-complex protein 1 subunit zeta
MSSALEELAPNAEIIHSQQALAVNCSAAAGLAQVLKSNLGPTGSLKLLVGGTIDQLKLTKDGLTLLKEMQIQHPTAALIARAATAQDDVTGDGTTSTVLLVGALLQQAYRHVQEGLHPRVITTGYDLARDACLEFLKSSGLAKSLLHVDDKASSSDSDGVISQTALLTQVAKTSLQTKLDAALVPQVTFSSALSGLLFSSSSISFCPLTQLHAHSSEIFCFFFTHITDGSCRGRSDSNHLYTC